MFSQRVLVAAYYVPEPDRDTGSRRVSDIMALLHDAGWAVSFLAVNSFRDRRYVESLQQKGVEVHDGAKTSLESLVTAAEYQLAVVAYWPVGERVVPGLRRASPATHVIVDSIDLHFVREARRALQRPGHSGSARLLTSGDASQMVGELNVYGAADAVLTVSEKEAAIVNDLTGQTTLAHTLQLLEDASASRVPLRHRRGVLTFGNYEHAPNVQAVEFLCQEVLPRVAPDVLKAHSVSVVGAGLDETVRAYGRGVPHVKMIGWVPSVLPYLRRSRITVVPLRYGAGVKGKLVQALRVGTPTVSTSIGAEGLSLVDGSQVLIADDSVAFGDAMTRLLTDDALWRQLQSQGRRRVASYGRHHVARRLRTILDHVMALEPKGRILPEVTDAQYQARVNYQYHQQVMPRIREVVRAAVPTHAIALVASGGADDLLTIDVREAWHFPQSDRGVHDAGKAVDGDALVAHLDELRARGAQYLVLPAPTMWWLNRFTTLRSHLDQRADLVARRDDVCVIFALDPAASLAPDAQPHALATRGLDGDAPHPDRAAVAEDASDSRSGPGDGEDEVGGLGEADGQPSAVRLIAFYLPQFHPIPENDAAWGEGFTEWTNVVTARELFPGHAQPQAPGELGFYDLRSPETRSAQAELARQHGIFGFCYYHYWFNGKRLLGRPFDDVLASGEPDFPFCLCWANEPWSRRWDGSAAELLQPQIYSAADDLAHIEWLLPALGDPRAITIDGKPLFLVYQGRELPDAVRTIDVWRAAVDGAGLPGIHLVAVETGWDAGWDATRVGFDAKVLFQPQFSLLRRAPALEVVGKDRLEVYDYNGAWPLLENPDPVPYLRYDSVFPGWDNSPRTGDRAIVVHNASPVAYEQWLRRTIVRAQRRDPEHQVVFINAWNEWAESCHLEPDLRHGRAFLEATRRARHMDASTDHAMLTAVS